MKILDEVTYIREEAERLKSHGVNILIALGHSGYAKDQVIAKDVTEIDLVVGGHSHTFLYNGKHSKCEFRLRCVALLAELNMYGR